MIRVEGCKWVESSCFMIKTESELMPWSFIYIKRKLRKIFENEKLTNHEMPSLTKLNVIMIINGLMSESKFYLVLDTEKKISSWKQSFSIDSITKNLVIFNWIHEKKRLHFYTINSMKIWSISWWAFNLMHYISFDDESWLKFPWFGLYQLITLIQ